MTSKNELKDLKDFPKALGMALTQFELQKIAKKTLHGDNNSQNLRTIWPRRGWDTNADVVSSSQKIADGKFINQIRENFCKFCLSCTTAQPGHTWHLWGKTTPSTSFLLS